MQRQKDVSIEPQSSIEVGTHQIHLPYQIGAIQGICSIETNAPQILLHGTWLSNAGFTPGSQATLSVSIGQLLIKLP